MYNYIQDINKKKKDTFWNKNSIRPHHPPLSLSISLLKQWKEYDSTYFIWGFFKEQQNSNQQINFSCSSKW